MLQDLTGIFPVLWRPDSYFRSTEPALLRRRSLVAVGLLLVVLSLLVFASALLNSEAPRQIQADFLRRLQVDPTLVPPSAVPYSALLFGVYWCLLLGLLGLVRYVFLRILGDAGTRPGLVWWVGVHGALPIILAGGLISLANNLFPPGLPVPGDTGLGRLVAVTGVSGLALLWEVLVSSAGLRALFAQNPGRAVLTALVPWLLLFQILLLI